MVGGKVVVEGLSLPDGTSVAVLARGDEAAVPLPLEQETEILNTLGGLAARRAFLSRSFLHGSAVSADLGSRRHN